MGRRTYRSHPQKPMRRMSIQMTSSGVVRRADWYAAEEAIRLVEGGTREDAYHGIGRSR